MRTLIRTVGWIGLVCIVTVVAVIGGVYLTHPRDEAAYLKYVARFGQDPQHLSKNGLLDAGDQACAWLSHQPPALWRTGDGYGVADLYDEYRRAVKDEDGFLPDAVLPGAWSYLCPATELLVKPHYVFSEPNGD